MENREEIKALCTLLAPRKVALLSDKTIPVEAMICRPKRTITINPDRIGCKTVNLIKDFVLDGYFTDREAVCANE